MELTPKIIENRNAAVRERVLEELRLKHAALLPRHEKALAELFQFFEAGRFHSAPEPMAALDDADLAIIRPILKRLPQTPRVCYWKDLQKQVRHTI